MSRALSDPQLDVVIFPTVYSFVPIATRARKFIFIHDIIAETYPELTFPRLTARAFWKIKVALARRQADEIMTVSDYSREGLMRRFGIKPEKIRVVGEAGDAAFRRKPKAHLSDRLRAQGIVSDQRLVVYIGGFNPHKNLETLIDAFTALACTSEFADARLLMVGERKRDVFHSYAGAIEDRARESSANQRIIFTDFLPDDELADLLNLSSVCVLPSLMEGYGLPAVEAAACGCPVIATRESPLPALLGQGGIYFDPRRQTELEDALKCVLRSETLRAQMGCAGSEAANRLTWTSAAQAMLDCINGVEHPGKQVSIKRNGKKSRFAVPAGESKRALPFGEES